jgi:arylsulfatase A-like enzyme
MKITRREFIERSSKISAAALLGVIAGTDEVFGRSGKKDKDHEQSHPNILLIMVDQQHMPPQGYGAGEGLVQELKEILGFQKTISPDNPFTQCFPGFLRLRQNAVVMRTHYTVSSACTPSRTSIMTGQYPNVTGVDATDGMFKIPEDMTWLDPDGMPTIGDWFLAMGYPTHYFGKWHVSYPDAPDYLKLFGFLDSDSACPDPHRGGPENLGVYRDVGFADKVVDFLKTKGEDQSGKPWLAVGSLVNPHDNGSWPIHWQLPENPDNPDYHGVVPWTDYPPPPGIPAKGETSLPCPPPMNEDDYNCIENILKNQGLVVDLNLDGFPQDNCSLPPTFEESLTDKPRCQYDYSLKFGLAIQSQQESDMPGIPSPYPFQLQGENASTWSLAFNQFYYYCQYLADRQLSKILQALDDNRLTENTIVVFLSDHGEMAGAHGGMIQKFHSAYEEMIRVPMVISSPLINKNPYEMREILQPTSSIDVAPTLVALAGYKESDLRHKMEAIHGKSVVRPFVGANLVAHLKGRRYGDIPGPDGRPRTGVFYMTNDMVTEPGDSLWEDQKRMDQFNLFLQKVDDERANGYPLASGTVRQPNNVRALCTGDWKIVRYVDPRDDEPEPDEWELYCLKSDPIEQINLVDFRTGDVRKDVTVPGLNRRQLVAKNMQLRKELARQEAFIFGKSI